LSGPLPKKKNATKLVYGSDFPYRSVPASTDVWPPDAALRGSYATGGLSNVWGSAILPYRQEDMEGWPISEAELAGAYRDVFKFLPLAARLDSLADLFPLYTSTYSPLPQSHQTATLMRHLERNRAELNAAQIFFGSSRVAVDAAGTRTGRPCIACGRCLHGCPRELIYASSQSLPDLQTLGVRYVRGVVVTSLEEVNGHVRIQAYTADGVPQTFDADRVFLAAGVVNTTTILLRALKRYDQPVQILDSQYYLYPMIQATAAPNVKTEDLHTLCQAFIEIKDVKVSPHTVHLQIYSYNDFLAQMLQEKIGRLSRIFPHNMVLGRLLLVQGYLHSDHSGRVVATLKRRSGVDQLTLEPFINPATRNSVKRVLRKMQSVGRLTSSLPVGPLLEITEPGRGFHSGGAFPMASSPNPRQTDRIGRPYGLTRTHVVDSTVFPSIPATTITLTIMANSYRIGREAAALDASGAL
jgi:choline dehydrogenase-like flavoprotein